MDFRTDILALGLLIYELISGVNPFAAATVTATVARIVETEPPPLSSVQPDCLPDLDRIVATCLRKNPLERYQSTQDLVAEFERLEAALAMLRQRQSDRRVSLAQPSGDVPRSTALWWSEFHQLAISAIYAVMIYPTWYARRWLDEPRGMVFLFAVLAAAALAASLRLHLRFLARHAPGELGAQRARTRV